MNNPDVVVEEITNENVGELVEKHGPRGVDLGDADREEGVNTLISRMRDLGGRRFLLSWTGGKVPSGACVLDQEIVWTQHGIVRAEPGGDIGSYDRLVEFGGESGNEQVIIVYLYPSFS